MFYKIKYVVVVAIVNNQKSRLILVNMEVKYNTNQLINVEYIFINLLKGSKIYLIYYLGLYKEQ